MEAGEEEIERAASVSVTQAERGIHAGRFDMHAERANPERDGVPVDVVLNLMMRGV